jgi:23S rRNA (uracil1939-C5)-methyltransferase
MNDADVLTLTVEKPVAGGRMLARHDGAVVLVAGALPGEVIEAQVERTQRGTAWARTVRVLTPSAHRVGEPNPCGGCVLAHASYPHQLELKQQIVVDAFRRVARITLEHPVTVVPSPAEGYRMRARLHVSLGRLGFYREGSHEICDAAGTHQLLPATLEVLQEVGAILATVPDVVQGIELAENREATERALHLELSREADPSGLAPVTQLSGLTGVSLSHAGSLRVRVLSGEPRVTDHFTLGGATWELSRAARAFFQGNRFLIDALVEHVIGALHAGAVTDLYAGVGLFSAAAVALGHVPVVAVEGDDVSAYDLRQNTERWKGLLQVRHMPVEDYLRKRRAIHAQTLVLDPPRTGLSRQALAGIAAVRAPRIVYVSCDVPTLARDTRALVDAGYQISGVRAFDLFPNTAHVETVAALDLAG